MYLCKSVRGVCTYHRIHWQSSEFPGPTKVHPYVVTRGKLVLDVTKGRWYVRVSATDLHIYIRSLFCLVRGAFPYVSPIHRIYIKSGVHPL